MVAEVSPPELDEELVQPVLLQRIEHLLAGHREVLDREAAAGAAYAKEFEF